MSTGMEETPPLTPAYSVVPTKPLGVYTDDESRWRAVQLRDAAADGEFIYCVRTTKVYCRPVCKARLARRSNVIFVSNIQEAQKAGYRACKRCKPDSGHRMPEEEAIRKIQDFLGNSVTSQQGGKAETLESMSKAAGLSKWHFHRVFKSVTGMTPVEYAKLNRDLNVQFDGDVQSMQTLPWNDLLVPGLSTPSTMDNSLDMQWELPTDPRVQDLGLPWLDADDDLADVRQLSRLSQKPIICYKVQAILTGSLLVAFQDGRAKLIQQINAGADYQDVLQRSFPCSDYTHINADDYGDGSYEDMCDDMVFLIKQRVDEIAQLLEKPL